MANTWLTPALIVQWLHDQGSAVPVDDRPSLQLTADAVAGWVETELHPGFWSADVVPVYDPPLSIRLGAIMFAARLYERRGTVLGVPGYSELGGSPILREDPDIARLLRIGRFGRFMFGAPTLPVEETP